MAITASILTGGQNKTTSASTVLTLSASFAIGDLCIVPIAADNSGTGGITGISGVTDTQGNTYTLLKTVTFSSAGAANDGTTVAIYGSVVTTALTASTDTVTVSYSPNVAADALRPIKVSGMASTPYETGSATGAGGGYSVGPTASLATGDIVIVAVAHESPTVPGGDSDTSNGSWSTGTIGTTGGGDATNQSIRVGHKVVTGAGAQTFNGGATGDWAAAYVVFTVPSTTVPAQPRSVVPTPSVGQVSVAFDAPPGESLLIEPFTGTNGDPPDARWTVDGTAVTNIQSNTLRMNADNGEYARALLDDDYPADVEIVGSVTITQDVEQYPLVSFRGDGVWDTGGDIHSMNNGYYLLIVPSANQWYVRRKTAGGDFFIDGDSFPIAAGDVINWILQVDGDDIGLRLWVQGTTEPTGFATNVDTNHPTGTRLALSTSSTVNGTIVDWDNYRVGNFTDPGTDLYRVTFDGGTYSETGATSPIVVTGVAAGTYTDLVVEASNDGGATWGPASFTAPSVTVTGVTGTLAETLGDVTSAAAGASGASGTVARTLSDVTSTASGASGASGTLAEALADVTVAASGTHVPPITGTADVTLANVTSTASGASGASGALAETLADVTATTAGYGQVTGELAETLGDVTSAAAGGVPQTTGTLAVTLANVTATTAGIVAVTGTLARTLGAVTSTASGSQVTGTLARTLENATVAASGGSSATGTLNRTLDPVVVQATGGLGVTGTVNRTLGNVTAVATGAAAAVGGTVNVTLDSVETAAPLTDENGDPITDESGNPILVRGAEGSHGIGGTLDETLADVVATATGATPYSGSLAETLDDVTVVATGTHGVPGTLAETLEDVTSTADGSVGATGSLAVTLGDITSAADGTATPPGDTIAGNLAVTLDAVVAAAGGSSTAGTVANALADVTVAASGTFTLATVTGVAAIVLADVTSQAAGHPTVIGTLARTLANVIGDGVGSSVVGTANITLGDVTSTTSGAVSITVFGTGAIGNVFDITGGIRAVYEAGKVYAVAGSRH